MAKPIVVEDHSQLLLRWAEKGIRDATLINIDTHDDFRWIPDAKIDALRAMYSRNDWKGFSDADTNADKGLYNVGNWIYAGARLGLFKEVCWVIPGNLCDQPNSLDRLSRFLKHFSFQQADISTFVARDNRFYGSYHGIPVIICGIESLPDFKRPLLLSIDTDFFPSYTDNYQVGYLTSLSATFDALYKANYQILESAVCYSVNGEYLLPIHRWVGDTIAAILKQPKLIYEQPSELLTLLQHCDTAYRSGDAASIVEMTGKSTNKQLPSLLLYEAYAHLQLREYGKSFNAAMKACAADPQYCTGLPFLAMQNADVSQNALVEKFFRAGFEVNPDMENGIFDFANYFRRNGKLHDAVNWYKKSEQKNGYFPSRLLLAETRFALGHITDAINDVEYALNHLNKDVFARVTEQETSDSIYSLLNFCEKNGLTELISLLKQTSMIKEMVVTYKPSVKN